jgi:hypothetical protein
LKPCQRDGHKWKNQGTYSKCKVCGKSRRNAVAPVKVQRVVPETGEIIEQQVSPAHFKPKKAKLVTADFRAKVLAGDMPGLIFPGAEDCPVEQGQEIDLTPNVSIAINRITKTKGDDHRCRYTVIDRRAALPRRTPGMFEPPETDAEGFPIPHTKEAIAAATIDGNYCQGSSQAVPDVAEEVDIQYRRVLGTKARAKDAGIKREEQPMQEAEKDLQRVNAETKELAKRAVKMGIAPTVALAPVVRALKEAHADLTPEMADILNPSAEVV